MADGPDRGGDGGGPDDRKDDALSALLREVARSPSVEPAGWDRGLHPGAVVGRFELVREVGRGGFGVVYEARDRELRRTVAFKAVRAGERAPAREELLLREAEAAARLSHPNIVTLHDVGRCEFGPYLVLEFLRGETLARRLGHGRLTPAEALRIGVEVAKGMAHAHAGGVVHRDLTPGNVFLCEDGQVKVLDLGMAHAFGRRKVDGGTPAYMAPEQWRGAPEDERTDVYALGAILHQMLTGALPHPENRRRPPEGPPPALEVPEAPGLGTLVCRMLEPDPVARPRDAAATLAHLAGIQQEMQRTPSGADLAAARTVLRPPAHGARLPGSRGARRALAALAAAAALALGLALAWRLARPGGGAVGEIPRPTSIAVLPFVDMSAEKDQEYFSDGLSEEIINALSHVDGLYVTGRTSSFAFRNHAEDLRDIGRALNVGTVLEGSVRKAGKRVRITAQIVSVADGYHLWSQTFDRELTDVFAVQDEIARAVVAALKLKVLPGELTAAHRTPDPEVYSQYLLGQQSFARRTEGGLRRAVAAYEGALARSPDYAPAWAGLALALAYRADYAESAEQVSQDQRRSLEAADRAVALAPALPEAYAARGYVRASIRWDWAGAQADMEKALASGSGRADTLRLYGTYVLAPLGRFDEAIRALRRAVELDPLSDSAWQNLAFWYNARGELGPARDAIQRALEIAPEDPFALSQLATNRLLAGRPQEALAAAERCPGPLRLAAMALAQQDLGRPEEARRTLDELTARFGHDAAYQIAQVHAWRRDPDRAFEWLERATEQRDAGLMMLKHDPFLRHIRADPRYRALLLKMNLPAD